MANIEGDIKTILEENSLIGSGFTAYESSAKQTDDEVIVIAQYGGLATVQGGEFPRVQILIRSKKVLTARDKAQEIFMFFSMFDKCSPHIETFIGYALQIFPIQSSPIPLGFDQTHRRYEFVINVEITRIQLDALLITDGTYFIASPTNQIISYTEELTNE